MSRVRISRIKKLMVVLLSVSLLGGLLPENIKADGAESVEKYDISIVSSEIEPQEKPLYKIQDQYYMDIEDVAALSRFTVEKEEKEIVLNQGVRQLRINTEKKQATELWGETFDFDVKAHEEKWLVRAIPTLEYLGTICSFENQTLICNMPEYTFWELWDNKCLGYLNAEESIWKGNLEQSLLCDMIIDAIFGHGIYTGMVREGEAYVEDALNEIINVNVFNRDSVLKELEKNEEKKQNMYSQINNQEVLKKIYDMEDEFFSMIDDEHEVLKNLISTTCLDKVDDRLKKIKDEKYTSIILWLNDTIRKISKFSLYDANIPHMLESSYNKKSLEIVGIDRENITAINVIDHYIGLLVGDEKEIFQLVINEVAEKIAEKTMQKGVELIGTEIMGIKGEKNKKETFECIKSATDLHTSFIKNVREIIYAKQINSHLSDLKAASIFELNYNTANILYEYVTYANQNSFADETINESILETCRLFYRQTVAFCDNALQINRLDSEQIQNLKKICEEAEVKLFQFTNCGKIDVPEYNELKDTVLPENLSNDVTDTSAYSTCGYVLKANDDLYYMRFTLDSMDYEMQLKTTSVMPVSEGTYDLVCRHSDGTEEVIDQLTGYNQMGLANGYLFYSRKEDGSDYVYGINMKTGEKIHLEKGTLVDANGYAIVYQDAQKRLHGFGSKGEDNILPYEKYLGMEGDWIYTCKIDNGGQRFDESGDVSIAKVNQANLEKKELAHITAPVNSDSSRDTVFSCFKTDQGDTYYSFVYKYGRFGFLLDGPIYRLRDGASEPELLVEEAGGDFQIRKADGKTYLAFYQFKKEENGEMATYMLDVETGEIVDTMYQDLVAIQGESAHWNEKGVYAVLDGTGEQSVLLTNDQLQQLGFTEYNNSHANKESIFSVQDDGVYLYLCYGEEQHDIDGTVLATFQAERGMLIRTNPDTGKVTVIYEMTKQGQDTKETTLAGYDWLMEPSLDADDIIVYDGTRGYQGTFQTDLSIMVQNGKYGIVDANGQVLVPCEYERYNLCTCGMVSINDEMGMEVTIGADGLRYTNFEGHGVPEKYHENQDYITLENPYFSDNNCSAVKRDGKWGYQDSNGKEILPCMFNELHINWVDPNRGFTQYQPVFSFSENLVAVATDKGAGYYDIDGNEIIPCGEFEQARPVHDGKAWVKKNGKWGIIHIQYEYTGTKVTYAHASESKMENMTPYKRDDSYILPESNSRVYDVSELQALSIGELELAREEIDARHGKRFKRPDLQMYFREKSWYRGMIAEDEFDESAILSDVEKANLNLIKELEEGTLSGDTVVELSDYFANIDEVIKGLGLQVSDERGIFAESSVVYRKGNFKLDTWQESNQNNEILDYIIDNQNPTIAMFGVKCGQNVNQALETLKQYASTYMSSEYDKDVNTKVKSMLVCYRGEIYSMSIDYHSEQNIVTGWGLSTYFELNLDSSIFEQLKKEDAARYE